MPTFRDTNFCSSPYFHHGVAAVPVLMTDRTGRIVDERRYEPFGGDLDSWSETAIGMGQGRAGIDYSLDPQNALNKETDRATGWSYHGARWMGPEIARWLSPDPPVKVPAPKFMAEPWGLNPYGYVLQNPSVFWDPDGNAEKTTLTLDEQRFLERYLEATTGDEDPPLNDMIDLAIDQFNYNPRSENGVPLQDTLEALEALQTAVEFVFPSPDPFKGVGKIVNKLGGTRLAGRLWMKAEERAVKPSILRGVFNKIATAFGRGPCDFCLAADTLVLTPSGLVPVSEISAGDFVSAVPGAPASVATDWKDAVLVTLALPDPQTLGEVILAELLRPSGWLETLAWSEDGRVWLELEEFGIEGYASIIQVAPTEAPAPPPGAARVLSHITRFSRTLLEVGLDDGTTLLATPSHQFLSGDGQEWLPASRLSRGVQVATRDQGAAAVSFVVQQPGLFEVHNLEIEGAHAYLVSSGEVVTHNACAVLSTNIKKGLRQRAQTLFNKQFKALGKTLHNLRMEVHHRIPLEWAHLFPGVDPNRRVNLVALKEGLHSEVSAFWAHFKSSLGGRTPTRAEVVKKAIEADEIIGSAGVSAKVKTRAIK
jgi:RHS repeat-associated protein